MNTPTQEITLERDQEYLLRQIATVRGYNVLYPHVLKCRVLQFLNPSPVSIQCEVDKIEFELLRYLASPHIDPVSEEVTNLLQKLQKLQDYAQEHIGTNGGPKTKVSLIFDNNQVVPHIQKAAAAILDKNPHLTSTAV